MKRAMTWDEALSYQQSKESAVDSLLDDLFEKLGRDATEAEETAYCDEDRVSDRIAQMDEGANSRDYALAGAYA